MEKNLTLFVGGLVSRVTEKDLKDIFENYGVISNIKIIKNQKNNYSKGYGFIDAESEEHMNQIIKMKMFKVISSTNVLAVHVLPSQLASSQVG